MRPLFAMNRKHLQLYGNQFLGKNLCFISLHINLFRWHLYLVSISWLIHLVHGYLLKMTCGRFEGENYNNEEILSFHLFMISFMILSDNILFYL